MGTVLENIMCARPRGHLHGREAIKDKAYPYLQTGQVGDGSGSPLFYVTGDYGTGNAASRRRRRWDLQINTSPTSYRGLGGRHWSTDRATNSPGGRFLHYTCSSTSRLAA